VEKWQDGTPFRYGYRVPCVGISPYARPGHVSHETHSLTSLLRFTEVIFDLNPLTARDAAASTLLDCFDFKQIPNRPLSLLPRDCPV